MAGGEWEMESMEATSSQEKKRGPGDKGKRRRMSQGNENETPKEGREKCGSSDRCW